MLGHKESLKIKEIWNRIKHLSVNNTIMLETNYKEKKCKRYKHMEAKQHATNEAMNHRKNQGGNKKLPRDKWKQKYNYPKLMDAAKAVVRGKIIPVQSYLISPGKSDVKSLTLQQNI